MKWSQDFMIVLLVGFGFCFSACSSTGKTPMNSYIETENSLLIRTDFSDDSAWESFIQEVNSYAYDLAELLDYINDPAFAGLTTDALVNQFQGQEFHSFILVADQRTFTESIPTVEVISLVSGIDSSFGTPYEVGQTIRATARGLWDVVANLPIGNMDFGEIADSAGADGVLE